MSWRSRRNQFQAWLSSQQKPGPGRCHGVHVHLDHEGGRMTLLADRPVAHEHEHEHHEGPTGLLKWMTSTDHKLIGMNYMVTSLVMFFLAGLMALALRTQLAHPRQLVPRASSSTTRCSPCTAA